MNFWYFYTGAGYENVTRTTVAYYAKEHISYFKDMSIDTICKEHIYWATDNSNYEAMYNGDTYVLFTEVNDLPELQRKDAMNHE